jgi:acyl carrier protein
METTTDSLIATLEKHIAKFTAPECRNVVLSPTTHLVNELGIDSARMIDIVLDVEDTFNITMKDEEIDSARTFGDLLELVRSKTQAKGGTA